MAKTLLCVGKYYVIVSFLFFFPFPQVTTLARDIVSQESIVVYFT